MKNLNEPVSGLISLWREGGGEYTTEHKGENEIRIEIRVARFCRAQKGISKILTSTPNAMGSY